jgi:hypothetical protein
MPRQLQRPWPVPPPLADLANTNLSFVSDQAIRGVLERDLRELSRQDPETAPKTVVVLCGAVTEGLLMDAVKANLSRALATTAATNHKVQNRSDLTDRQWTLAAFVEVASEMGVVAKTIGPMLGPVVKDFRNLVHPAVELRDGLKAQAEEAKLALALLEAVIRDLRGYASRTVTAAP